MEYFELRNKLFFPVRRKLINDYQMGTLDFERCEQLVNDLILKIGQYMDTGVPQDESMAIVFAEFQDTIQELRPLTKGYEITCDTNEQFHIPHALYVCVFRDLVGTEFADESYATKLAERDGVKLIFGMPQVPDGLYLDTEQNREIIQKYLAHKTPTTGRSDSIGIHSGSPCFDALCRVGILSSDCITFHLLFDFCGVPLQGYLYKKTCGTQNSPHAFAQDGRDLFKRGIRLSRKQKSAQRSERPLDAMQHGN